MDGANDFLYQISIGGESMLYPDAFFANLNMVVRIGGYLCCEQGDVWANERAEFEQNKFYYITKGACVINIEGKEYRGKAGDCFFIPANTKHGYYNVRSAPFEKYWFHFDLYPNSTIFKTLGLGYRIHVADGQMEALFAQLHSKQKGQTLPDKLDVKSLAIRILSSYIAASHKGTKFRFFDPEEQISVVLAYINQNLGQHLSNTELSELCHLHPNHFVRFFKHKTGTTPQKYIMEQRIRMAKRLIEQTDLKFSDIAAQVGRCDAAHLSKAFKRFYSLTPLECRKLRDRW